MSASPVFQISRKSGTTSLVKSHVHISVCIAALLYRIFHSNLSHGGDANMYFLDGLG